MTVSRCIPSTPVRLRKTGSSIRCSAGGRAGISVGVNLNPDKVCNFDCIYCQVDRTRAERDAVRRDRRRCWPSWTQTLDLVASGELYETDKFRDVAGELRRLNDIAFSGDGEPTTFRNFDEIIEHVAASSKRVSRAR